MIYLDNAATTRPYDEVIEQTADLMRENYFNPSSNHEMGMEIDKKIKAAKETILKRLGAAGELIFTSGGTESNNLVIHAKAKKHIITTKSEHPSIASSIDQIKNNVRVDYVNLLPDGKVDLEHLKSLITDETSLVSIIHINNETGVIQDINEIGKIIKQSNSKTSFHVDGVAAFGKKKINLENVDLYTFTSHKIHGPQSVGALFIRKNINLRPMLFGGDQQNKVRPGTENRIGILGFATATELIYERLEKNIAHTTRLKEKLLEVTNDIANIVINSGESPFITNLSFVGLKAQVLVNVLSENGIYVSTGAACSGKSNWNVLKAMGKEEKIYDSAIRFSFSEFNTIEEIEKVKEVLKQNVKLLRF